MTDTPEEKTTVPVLSEKSNAEDVAVRGRRALLKGAVKTMPMILTLQSGAALARSSNLISASRPMSALDADGRMLCMDFRYVDSVMQRGKLADLGEPPYASVNAILRGEYYDTPDGERVYRRQMCNDGGVYFKKVSGEYAATNSVPRGMLVSATALSSFAGRIDIAEI